MIKDYEKHMPVNTQIISFNFEINNYTSYTMYFSMTMYECMYSYLKIQIKIFVFIFYK